MGDHVNKLAVYTHVCSTSYNCDSYSELGLKSFLNNTGYGCVAGYSGGWIDIH